MWLLRFNPLPGLIALHTTAVHRKVPPLSDQRWFAGFVLLFYVVELIRDTDVILPNQTDPAVLQFLVRCPFFR